MARHFEARLPQRGDDLGSVPHRAVLDTLDQVVPDQVAGGGFEAEPGLEPRRFDVGAVGGLFHSGPRRIVGPTPAVFVVEGVPEGAEGLLPPGRRDVEAPPGLEVAPRREDMDVRAAATFAVQYGSPSVAIGFKSRPSRLLELVEDGFDLRVGGLVVGGPGDHARGVFVLELQRVGHRSHLVGISPQQLDALAWLPGGVPLAEKVVGRRRCRAGSAGEELNEHRSRGSRRKPVPGAPVRWRPVGRRSRRPRPPPCGCSPTGRSG